MQCPKCGYNNPDRVNFCNQCGERLQFACSKCGHENLPGSEFCHKCGAPLTPGSTLFSTRPTSFAGGRYLVRRFLGEGSMKKVYLVEDTSLDREVAFALLKTEKLSEESRARISREVKTMGHLGEHPNILTIYDVGEYEGQLYIVTPFMSGGRMEDVINSEPDHQLPIDRVIKIMKSVCQGLEHAHSKGIVHRDLKPSNIFLDAEGTAHIGDFGLALAKGFPRVTEPDIVMGTASYMPPEQATGGEITPRSDYYSLGVMLYEMVTGRLPFTGDNISTIIAQHINSSPVLPSRYRQNMPGSLETLIMQLMEKNPQRRPDSVADIIAMLDSIDILKKQGQSLETSSRLEGYLAQRVFVGREQELKQLRGIYDRVISGKTAIVIIEGEPGIGKSALCEQLTTYISLRSGNILRGYCEESSIPYLPFVEVIRTYILTTGATGLKQRLGEKAFDLARIVPELKDRLKIKLRSSGDPQEERYRLMQAVSGFLTDISISNPLVIIIEDLHNADKSSLEMLSHIARNVLKTPLLIIANFRDTELDRNQPLSEMLADLQRIPNYWRFKLRELNNKEVRLMISTSTRHEASRDLADIVHKQTEGNPLFINEVLRYIVEEEFVNQKMDRAIITGSMVKEMGIPKGLHDVISKRLSKLSPECKRILSIGAVIGKEFRLDLLKILTRIPDDELFPVLREAKRAMVVEEHVKIGAEVTYRFSHDFFRKTIYEEIIAPERIKIHQQVAQALESVYSTHLEEHAVELTEHFCHSSNPDDLVRAVKYGEMAARQAQEVFAHGEAIRLWEHTLEVQETLDINDKARRCDLLLALGDALINEGEPRRILDIVAPKAWSLAEEIDDTVRSSRVCHLAMLALFFYGIGRAWMTPEAALWAERSQSVAEPGTVASARADTATGIVKCANGYLIEGIQFLTRAIQTVRIQQDADTYWWAAAMWMLYASGFQHDEEITRISEELANSPRRGISPGVLVWTLVMIIDTFFDHARRLDAEEILHEAQALIERNGQARFKVFSMAGDALFATLDGHLEEAVNIARRIKEIGEEGGFIDLTEILVFTIGMRPLLYLGMTEEALKFFTSVQSPAAMALCFAHLGQSAEATDLLEKCLAPRYSKQYVESEDETPVYGDTMLLETAVLLGHYEAADLLFQRLATCQSRTTGIFHATCIDRHLAAAASILGRHDEALKYYHQALEISQNMKFRPEIALTRLQFAEYISSHHPEEKEQVIEHLDFVIGEFRDLKMQPSLERALLFKDTFGRTL